MLSLPPRHGPKPKTNYGLPHEQLDQNPPADVYDRLKAQAFRFRVRRAPAEHHFGAGRRSAVAHR